MQTFDQEQKRNSIRSDFDFHEQIGSGSFGKVYRAVERASKKTVAIKILPKCNYSRTQSPTMYKRLQREIQVQSRLNHPSICRLYGYFMDNHNVYIVLEYCAKGSLHHAIRKKFEVFSDRKIASIMQIMFTAVYYLSLRNVIHRDIKLQNILFDSNYNPKITDFGCCVHTKSERQTLCGTKQYLCPEMVKKEKYGFEVDLYCLGIVLYELFFFKTPFQDQNEEQFFKNVIQGVVIFDDEVRKIPQSAKNLIKSLLLSKQKRPSLKEVMNHPFLKQFLHNDSQPKEKQKDAERDTSE